ncbi:MAG: glutamate 5-kinase [Treponema sp.]|nr:glutamate 5-kinase [Treponema sp.]MBQ1662315.1 glutamate 5-kinase [Treponema sp.]MBR6295446.1 glutamate 5-kinase [Treponema sp.]MEE3312887.1 glutamate 5-kinase [Treponema sp.]
MTIQETIQSAKKIVVKFGSNSLAKDDGTINIDFLNTLAVSCSKLISMGKQIIIVSSGAQVAGLSAIDGWAHKKDMHYRQALCAIGQVELMDKWRAAFAKQNVHVAQLLFIKEDFEDYHHTLNMRNTLFTLVDEGVVPIINENDSVSFEENSIGDNDNLSALTAILWSADLLILFSDIDGIFTDNPKTNPDARLVEEVRNIPELLNSIKIGNTNSFGTGGIRTKIQAAEKVTSSGIPMILANSKNEKPLASLMDGTKSGTLFIADEKKPSDQ